MTRHGIEAEEPVRDDDLLSGWEEKRTDADRNDSAPKGFLGRKGEEEEPVVPDRAAFPRGPLLSPQAEKALLRRMEQGDAGARHQLVEANLPLVVSIAQKYAGWSFSLGFEDLVQEGAVGLMQAVDQYDPRRGCRLSTYGTWWIRQAITRAIACQGPLIRLPVNQVERLHRLRRATQELQQQGAREPTMEELAGALDWPVERVRELCQWNLEPVSLDQPVGEGEETWGDRLVDLPSVSPAHRAEQEELREQVGAALATLTPREQEVLRLRFGLADGWGRTLEEIGQQLGVSRERVRPSERNFGTWEFK